ncbi:transglycosylase SLT domain-containing protein [Bdellovibrionales bacterium]|nr:transglycosylase SLT domain-containing protein [Bdellovibrionales bacterium]
MKAWILSITPFFIMLGCVTSTEETFPTHVEVEPPKIRLEQSRSYVSKVNYLKSAIGRSKQLALLWWSKYRYADLIEEREPLEACHHFYDLANNPYFPMKKLALLRSYISCSKKSENFAKLPEFDPTSFPIWLSHYVEKALTKISLENSDHQTLLEIYLARSKRSTDRKEKVDFTEKALQQALSLKDPKLATSLTQRIYRLSPQLNPDPKPKQLFSVAYDLRRSREFTKSRTLYQSYLTENRLTLKQKLKALRGVRATYKIEKNDPLYLSTTEAMTNLTRRAFQKREPSLSTVRSYVKTHMLLARTYWTLNDSTKAKKVLLGLSRQVRKYPALQPEILWLLGRIDEERNHLKESIKWFSLALRYNIKNRSLKNKISWYYGWNLRRDGQYEKAIRVFSRLIVDTPDSESTQRFRASFWLAKTHHDMGDSQTASTLFSELVEEDPIGYYGLLAKRESGVQISIPSTETRASALNSDGSKVRFRKWFPQYQPLHLNWFMALNEQRASRKYIGQITKKLHKDRKAQSGEWIKTLRLYEKAGHQVRLRYEVALLRQTLREEIYTKAPALLFPTPYQQQVKLAAIKFKVYPELIYAIMRQESAFNPNARSPVDAFGLMQILPRTAKKVASANGIEYKVPEDLYLPFINIQIGSALLQELLTRHNGQFLQTVASYNAAESAINGWFKTRFRGDSMEFVEDIPYEETQSYIKLVLRNLVYYKLISSNKKQILFPEWCFKVKKVAKAD